jgi:hypothetical protein
MKKTVLATALLVAGIGGAHAGPVILGGDDLTDHGSFNGTSNLAGWLYIEKAIGNLFSTQTRAADSGAPITVDIVALGAADATPAGNAGNAGAAIRSAATQLGRTISFFDGATAINDFFTSLAGGGINPALIWLAGTGAANDLVSAEGAALTSNAAAIDTFVGDGGGLMAHGSGSVAYGWLTTLLPGLSEVPGCNSSGATLTAAGQAAFPGLTNANIDATAGPCHSHFTGNFGGLTVLANDGNGLAYIIGAAGGQGGSITTPPTSVPAPPTALLLGAGFAALGLARRRREG